MLIGVALVGCSSGDGVKEETQSAGKGEKFFANDDAPGLFLDAVSSTEERTLLQNIATDVDTLLTSAEFYENLDTVASGYTSIWLGTSRKSVSPAELVKTIKNEDASHRYVPTPVALVGAGQNDFAAAGQSGAKERVGNEDIWVTFMSIGRRHLARYRSRNAVEKSCSINTVAHERSHTFSSSPTYANLVVEDSGTGAPSIGGTTPIASYLIGSVAQCTSLQNAKRIAKSDVKACVEAFGISDFKNTRCDQFDASEAVKWPKDPPKP
jgi:hypothetical protein